MILFCNQKFDKCSNKSFTRREIYVDIPCYDNHEPNHNKSEHATDFDPTKKLALLRNRVNIRL